jgi:hypothetical protein
MVRLHLRHAFGRLRCSCGALVWAGFLAACGGQPTAPAPIAAPIAAPIPTPPVTPPPTIPPTGRTLSGMVFESTADGRRAVAGGSVYYGVDMGNAFARVPVDTNGQYTIPNVSDGSRIRLTALAAFGNGELEQPCGAYASVRGDTVRDIELVRPGAHGLSHSAPTLHGVVYYTTAEGPRPVAHTRVLYFSLANSTFDMYTTTDSDGRYEVCGFPLGPGFLGAGDCNDAIMQTPVEIQGDATVLDVDLTSLIGECPGVVIGTRRATHSKPGT